MDVGDPSINLYDLGQGCCSDVATMGDSKPHSVAVVVCADCQSVTHEAADCPQRKQQEMDMANRAKHLQCKADTFARLGLPSRLPSTVTPPSYESAAYDDVDDNAM